MNSSYNRGYSSSQLPHSTCGMGLVTNPQGLSHLADKTGTSAYSRLPTPDYRILRLIQQTLLS